MLWLPALLIVLLIAVVMLLPMLGQGRSPHLTYRPEQIDVGLDDVKGLVQLQSFDTPPLGERAAGRLIDWVNGWLPAGSQLAKRPPRYHNILVIAATNRADALDPAQLRPGRFDRRLYFDLPNAAGRRELIDTSWPARPTTRSWTGTRCGPSWPASPSATPR
jgi:hypothetical protein